MEARHLCALWLMQLNDNRHKWRDLHGQLQRMGSGDRSRELKKVPTPGCGRGAGHTGAFEGCYTTRRLWYNYLTRPYCQLPRK
jgi:hypothetical protein